eukprot:TRINITY_DN16432_c0_g1_i2.p1 TRINITY_DN16432_c0_g1~~TRINITY_DN16432_c0_g1_i2.p1  ORF type:complete len:121 (-),score=13.99 TRINITY_DN16432_c0_g1_i2:571-933(-)
MYHQFPPNTTLWPVDALGHQREPHQKSQHQSAPHQSNHVVGLRFCSLHNYTLQFSGRQLAAFHLGIVPVTDFVGTAITYLAQLRNSRKRMKECGILREHGFLIMQTHWTQNPAFSIYVPD